MKAIAIAPASLAPAVAEAIASRMDLHLFHSINEALAYIYTEPSDMIFIDGACLDSIGVRFVHEFKSNAIYRHLPVVAVFEPEALADIDWSELPIDDFVLNSSDAHLIASRLDFIALRSLREKDTNPLTRLPGNESIMRYIQKLFDEGREAAIAWVDLDHFKPFNDRYGFSRGDEVLLATARIIANAVKELKQEPSFVGHIGGDDFIFVVPVQAAKRLCEEIILRFDMIIKNFYNDEDLSQGEIISTDRMGNVKHFDLMSISIAVVMNYEGRYDHYGQVSGDAGEIKTCLKKLPGSNYMIDRRGRK
ncbi:MAG: putative diguanylate cyclase YeaP [Deltaproteobacteria bacterium ADurb.Bin510]|jgi:diguanylate cyclase (GGDEF)-like protein|nr:MAG: putative diguanylate cyclase YeaP [Deltaproteobacteria bacterium ADurb.Bin510]